MQVKINNQQLLLRRSLPLDVKIKMTENRIREWYRYWNGLVYVSFSGGKDSTVLLHIARKLYPDIEGVFSNTGVEFPAIVAFVKRFDNVTIIKPEKRFRDVIKEDGYPIVSKRVATYVRECKPTGKNDATRKLRMTGVKRDGTTSKMSKLSDKWQFLIDAPFKVSEKCCDRLKKQPFKKFAKESGKYPITGMMSGESRTRETIYMQRGCNWYDTKAPQSHPLSFWTDQDILKYITENNIEIASVYGEIIEHDGILTLTGHQRTGCIYCGFGAHMRSPNQYQLLYKSHPKLWDYCINKLGFGRVLDHARIPYVPEDILFCRKKK